MPGHVLHILPVIGDIAGGQGQPVEQGEGDADDGEEEKENPEEGSRGTEEGKREKYDRGGQVQDGPAIVVPFFRSGGPIRHCPAVPARCMRRKRSFPFSITHMN